MKLLFANNASTTLAGSISNTATSANLASGSGALFPNPTAGASYFVGTFTDAATGLLREIVWVTARTGDTITMTRGQEGTTALAWNANDLFSERWTAGQCAAMAQSSDLQAQAGNYAVDAGATNAILVTLTPALNNHIVGAPIRVKVANPNTSSAVTINPGPGAVAVVLKGGGLPPPGSIQAGIYDFIYDGTVYECIEAPLLAGAPRGTASGLSSANAGGAPNTQRVIAWTSLAVADANGNSATLAAGSVTLNSALAGAGGLDAGTLAANQVYYEHVIAQPGGANPTALMSLSATNPTLPSGYTMWARATGAAITDGSKNFYRIKQVGDFAQYIVTAATNTAAMPQVASGTTTGYQAVSLVNYVPSTAAAANLALFGGDFASGGAMVAPNANYGTSPGSNPPPMNVSGDTGAVTAVVLGLLLLESTNVYYDASGSSMAVAPSLNVLGWKDSR